MEIIITIAVIGFIIWIFSSSSSSKSNTTNKSNNSSSTNYQPKYDYYSDLKEKKEEEERKLKREIQQKEKNRREIQKRQNKIAESNQIEKRNNAIIKQNIDLEKERILDNYRIEYFFHMTHKNNLKSILQNGLYSHNTAYSSGLNNNKISNNDVIQIRSGKRDPINNLYINDYAPLYINPKNPMLYVRKNIEKDLVIIAFDRSLIYYSESVFTDGNAANRPTKFYNSLNDLNKINWSCLRADYWNEFTDGKRIRMAEVLVKEVIPSTRIRKLFCCSSKTLKYVNSLISKYEYIDAEIETKYFFDTYPTETNDLYLSSFDDDLPF